MIAGEVWGGEGARRLDHPTSPSPPLTPKGETGSEDLKWLYSSIYIVVPIVQILVAYPLIHYNWITMLGGVSVTVLSAWLRFAAVVVSSFSVALASSISAGVAAAVIVSSFSIVPERWFAPNERGLATAIGVQANYVGWAGGVLLPLYIDSCHWATGPSFDSTDTLNERQLLHTCLPVLLHEWEWLHHRRPPPGLPQRH